MFPSLLPLKRKASWVHPSSLYKGDWRDEGCYFDLNAIKVISYYTHCPIEAHDVLFAMPSHLDENLKASLYAGVVADQSLLKGLIKGPSSILRTLWTRVAAQFDENLATLHIQPGSACVCVCEYSRLRICVVAGEGGPRLTLESLGGPPSGVAIVNLLGPREWPDM